MVELVMGLRERFAMWCETRLDEKREGDVDSSTARARISNQALELSVQGSIRRTNKAPAGIVSKYVGLIRQFTEDHVPCQQCCYSFKRLIGSAGGPTALNVDQRRYGPPMTTRSS